MPGSYLPYPSLRTPLLTDLAKYPPDVICRLLITLHSIPRRFPPFLLYCAAMKRILLSIALACATFTSAAHADVFRCLNADGSTEFSFVPCEPRPPVKSEVVQEESVSIESARVEKNTDSLESRIQALETSLEDLRLERQAKISTTPSSEQQEIRLSYQSQINDTLDELIELRQRRNQRSR